MLFEKMSKIIKINESQRKRLFEAYRDGFSFKVLSMLGNEAFSRLNNSTRQYDYCVKWLGEPDGIGSSRCVFMLSDNIILKLAYGTYYDAGKAQNKLEYDTYMKCKSPLLPKVYDYDKDNFSYIICENVIAADVVDFEKFLGLPFYDTYYQNSIKRTDKDSKNGGDFNVGYNKYFDNIRGIGEKYYNDKTAGEKASISAILSYIEGTYGVGDEYYEEMYESLINKSEWLMELKELVKKTKMTDFCTVENFGIVNRNGKPHLVVLDCGLNMDVWEKYYDI